MHSPYLFGLLTKIHDEDRRDDVFDRIEAIRAILLRDQKALQHVEYGAGSRRLSDTGQRLISDYARTSLSSRRRCQMVFRLLTEHRPERILELGTSLGVMTAYLAAADRTAQVTTIDANPQLIREARKVAGALDLDNIDFHSGTFADILPGVLSAEQPVGFVLLDGDHKGEALIRYFRMVRPYLTPDAIILVDDIRWSRSMYEGWQALRQDPGIRCVLDYWNFGLLFFRPEFKEQVSFRVKG